MGNNALECSCQMVITMEDVLSAVTSATCSQNDLANGASFAASHASLDSYYSNKNATDFQCSE